LASANFQVLLFICRVAGYGRARKKQQQKQKASTTRLDMHPKEEDSH